MSAASPGTGRRGPLVDGIWLIANYAVPGAVGFVFLRLAATRFSLADVGLSTTLFATATLLGALARLGFDTTILRFLPGKTAREQGLVFTSFAAISVLVAMILSIGFAFLGHVFVAQLPTLTASPWMWATFCGIAISNAYSVLSDAFIISHEKARAVTLKNAVTTLLRLPWLALVPVVNGLRGILIAYLVSSVLSALVGTYLVREHARWKLGEIGVGGIEKEAIEFGIANYLGSIAAAIQVPLGGLLVLRMYGAE